ncbi:MAG: flagellar motor protein MotB [Myxococcota bacterium]
MSDDAEEGGFEEPTAPAWMATFGDLMSLLLTFFVLLMSFASMDVRRFAAVVGSMRDAFGVQKSHPGQMEAVSNSLVQISDTESTPYLKILDFPTRMAERDQSLIDRLKLTLNDQELERLLQIESTPEGVVVRVPGQMLFDPGSAELRPSAVVFLHEIGKLIETTPGSVSIDGHSDPTPTGQSRYGSNWELSTARAVAAVVHLTEVEGIDPDRLRATGYGSSRPLPNAEDPADHRRVEFVFLRSLPELAAELGAGPDSAASASGDARP